MKKLLLLLSVVFFIAGCSKDKQVVRQLDGEWKVVSIVYDNKAADKSDFTNDKYSFTKCNVKKGFCDGTYTTTDPDKGSITSNFQYSISEKGTKITIRMSFFGLVTETISDIVEHSKTKFVMSNIDKDNKKTVTTLEKM
jgi:hypothetical protein